jgi:hypothetical protein
MTLNYAVPHGKIKFVLFDERPESATRGELQEIYMGPTITAWLRCRRWYGTASRA